MKIERVMLNLVFGTKWLKKEKEKLTSLTYRAARFAPAKNQKVRKKFGIKKQIIQPGSLTLIKSAPPPFWRQRIFFSVSFFRKLIIHRFLFLKLFCSSKIVNFRAFFVKFSAAQTFFELSHI